jgi:hypothetical protein
MISIFVSVAIWKLNSHQESNESYATLTKTIDITTSLGLGSTVFTKQEIEEVKSTVGEANMAIFTANTFKIKAYTSGLLGFSTDMYLESLPSNFIDYHEADFKWDEGSSFVPLIISEDLLNMYNFGFAISQGLPQLSQSAIEQLKANLLIDGNGKRRSFSAGIVGVSSSVSTILAPLSFVQWANKNYGYTQDKEVNKLLVKIDGQYEDKLWTLVDNNEWKLNQKGSAALNSLFVIVAVVLALIALLIIGLTYMSYWNRNLLNFSRHDKEMRLAFHLGYTPKQLLNSWRESSPKQMFLFYVVLSLAFYLVSSLIASKLGGGILTDINTVIFLSIAFAAIAFFISYLSFSKALLTQLRRSYFKQ